MATILEFRASTDKPLRKIRRRRLRRSAEIVIFPGVRYERWPAPQAQMAPQVEMDPPAQSMAASMTVAGDKRHVGD